MSDYLPVPREDFLQTPSRSVVNASYLLMAGTLLLVMWQGLLPGLLSVCVGFMLTRALARLLSRLQRRRIPGYLPHWAQVIAAAVVMLAPLALLTTALPHTRGYIVEAPQQYKELL
ncbi:MAG: permease, partial [Comamonas sp.]